MDKSSERWGGEKKMGSEELKKTAALVINRSV